MNFKRLRLRQTSTHESQRDRFGSKAERGDFRIEGERGPSGRQLGGTDSKVQNDGDSLDGKQSQQKRRLAIESLQAAYPTGRLVLGESQTTQTSKHETVESTVVGKDGSA
jgi:hypothetical protein